MNTSGANGDDEPAVVVFAYVSGHGFGHWTRSEALLRRLAGAGCRIHVRTSNRVLALARAAPWCSSVAAVDVGPGLVQRSPLVVDVGATRDAVAAHCAAWSSVVAAEVAAARDAGVRGVFADVPSIAFAVAHALGVPAVGSSNFTWSWTMAQLARGSSGGDDDDDDDEVFARAAALFGDAERRGATRCISMPGGAGLQTLGGRVWAGSGPGGDAWITPWRPPHGGVDRRAARAAMPRPRGSPGERPVVLLSFGGFGDAMGALGAACGAMADFDFVSCAPLPRGQPLPPNVVVLPHGHDLHHQNLILGADCIIAKPGYGTVSECLEGPTPMVYVDGRADEGCNPEHAHLITMIQRWLPCAPLSPHDLMAGRWQHALGAAMAAKPKHAPPANGVAAAVDVCKRVFLGDE